MFSFHLMLAVATGIHQHTVDAILFGIQQVVAKSPVRREGKWPGGKLGRTTRSKSARSVGETVAYAICRDISRYPQSAEHAAKRNASRSNFYLLFAGVFNGLLLQHALQAHQLVPHRFLELPCIVKNVHNLANNLLPVFN